MCATVIVDKRNYLCILYDKTQKKYSYTYLIPCNLHICKLCIYYRTNHKFHLDPNTYLNPFYDIYIYMAIFSKSINEYKNNHVHLTFK